MTKGKNTLNHGPTGYGRELSSLRLLNMSEHCQAKSACSVSFRVLHDIPFPTLM
jgi:hypothetical protein